MDIHQPGEEHEIHRAFSYVTRELRIFSRTGVMFGFVDLFVVNDGERCTKIWIENLGDGEVPRMWRSCGFEWGVEV